MNNPLTFQIGLQAYALDDPLPDWRVIDGVPLCNACGKSVHFIWDSPPRSAMAMCGCTSANDERKVVQSRHDHRSLPIG
jgi:hypothetical protein